MAVRTLRRLAATAVLGVPLLLAAAAPAAAQDTDADTGSDAAAPAAAPAGDLVTATDPEALRTFLADEGYPFQREDDEGLPRLASDSPGTFYWIEFQGCTDGTGCTDVQFITGWDLPHGISMEKLNRWNQEKLYGKLYRDGDGDPWLTLMVNMDGGVSSTNFLDTVERWSAVLAEFEDYIGWNQS